MSNTEKSVTPSNKRLVCTKCGAVVEERDVVKPLTRKEECVWAVVTVFFVVLAFVSHVILGLLLFAVSIVWYEVMKKLGKRNPCPTCGAAFTAMIPADSPHGKKLISENH